MMILFAFEIYIYFKKAEIQGGEGGGGQYELPDTKLASILLSFLTFT